MSERPESIASDYGHLYDLVRAYQAQGVSVRYDLLEMRIYVGCGTERMVTSRLPEQALVDATSASVTTSVMIATWARALAREAERWENGLPPNLGAC